MLLKTVRPEVLFVFETRIADGARIRHELVLFYSVGN